MLKEILKKSLTISWRNYGLWFLGFFASLFFPFTNQIFLLFFLTEFLTTERVFSFGIDKTIFEKSFTDFYLNIPFTILLFGIVIFILVLCIFSEIFLIFSLKEIERKEKVVFKKSWQAVKNSFLPVSAVCLVGFFIFSSFLFLVRFFILSAKEWILFFIIFFFLLSELILALIILYIIFYFVTEKRSLKKALYSGLLFFRKNWLKTIFLITVLFLIAFCFGVFLWFIFNSGILFFPLRIGSVFLIKALGQIGFGLSFFFFALFVFLFQIIIIGFLNVYQTSCWVFFFSKKG